MDHIKNWLALDASSPSGLVWAAKPPRSRIKVGAPALASTGKGNRYYRGKLLGVHHFAHRVVFYLAYGYMPEQVDHIDGNQLNNNPKNLRDVSASENQHNAIARGYFPVRDKYRVQISLGDHLHHVGYYDNQTDARAAYLAAKRMYHPTAPDRVYRRIHDAA